MAQDRKPTLSGASSSQPSFSRDEVISLPSDSDDEGFPDMDTVFNNISSSQAARKPDRPASQARGPRTSLPSSSQPNPSSSSASSKARTSLAPKRKPPMDRSARAAASPDSSEPALEGRKRLRARVSSASTAPSAGPSSAKKSKPTTPSPVKGMATAADPIMLSDSDDASESDSPPSPKTRKPGPRPVVNAAPSKRTSLSASQSPQQPEPTSAQRQEPLFDRGSIASDAGTDPLAEGGSVDDHLMDVDLEASPTTSQDTANLHPEDAQISPPPSSSRTSATEELVVEDLSNDTARAETPSMVRDRPGHQSASPSPPTSDQPGPSLRAQQTDAEEADELDEALRMSEDATVQALAELPGEDVYLVPAMAASSGPRSDQASVSPRRMEERPTLSAKAKGKQRAQVVATPTRPSTIGLKEPTSAALASPRPLVVRSITSDTAVSSLARASRSSSASSSASRTSLALDASLSPGPPSAPLAPLRAFSHLQQQDDDFKPVFAPLVARASSGPPTHLMFLPSLEYNHPQPNITIRTADEREIRTRTELLFAVADVFEDFFLREDWEETLDEGVDGLRVLYLGASERMVGLLLEFASRRGNPDLSLYLPDDCTPMYNFAYQLGCSKITDHVLDTLGDALHGDYPYAVGAVAHDDNAEEDFFSSPALLALRLILNLTHPAPSPLPHLIPYTSPSLVLNSLPPPAQLEALTRQAIARLPDALFDLPQLPEGVCEFLGWKVAYKLTVLRREGEGWEGVAERWEF